MTDDDQQRTRREALWDSDPPRLWDQWDDLKAKLEKDGLTPDQIFAAKDKFLDGILAELDAAELAEATVH